jgi:hypothetical protein
MTKTEHLEIVIGLLGFAAVVFAITLPGTQLLLSAAGGAAFGYSVPSMLKAFR